MIGKTLGHYRIIEKVGVGGMGVIYRALDTHLDRFVAIKVLRSELVGDPERKRRFVLEAKSASALNQPNIVTIYDIDCADGVDFIAMEFIEGVALSRRIEAGLPFENALDCARQIAAALAAAHAAGIIHRDIKPANIMVTPSGHVKVLDFGLAKLTEAVAPTEGESTVTVGAQTRAGAVMGTVAYMSPEQAEGKPVDARSDVFAYGVVLYEMLAGRHPFHGSSALSTLTSILHEQPPRLPLPPALAAVLARCLEKDRERRYPSAAELAKELAAAQASLATPSLLRRPQVAIPALVLGLAAIAAGAWLVVGAFRARWARNVALPEIARLREQRHGLAALRLARQAERHLPQEPLLREIRGELIPISYRTTPPGAGVSCRDYGDVAEPGQWEYLGRTPIEKISLPPANMLRCRIEMEGFESAELALAGDLSNFPLHPPGAQPGMVLVPRGSYTGLTVREAPVEDFWLDKLEVTNRQFKEFVDRGGYQKSDYWKHPMVKDGRTLSREQAMAEFRDATGRPGPATWQLGTYPEGRAEFPVNGVSWFEAAAYAEFAGKSLPTVDHWFRAANPAGHAGIVRLSNFGGQGPARAGSYAGLGPFGTYDMAGNVKEWCLNPLGERRYLLGGAWSEATYLYSIPDAASPFERLPTYGFRCARYPKPLPDALTGPVQFVSRDRSMDKPVSDDIYRVYRNLHSYDKTDLMSVVDLVDDASEYWRKEKVTFAAAYGNERVIAYLFLPKNARAPYQTVVVFPGASALTQRSSEQLLGTPEYLIRSGRALVYPIYKGTYERGPSAYYHRFGQPSLWREMNIQWSKDLGRTLDYLETRTELDRARIAYYGNSLGASMAPRLTAVEERFRTGVLLQGGLFERLPPEVDALNFASRAKLPVLMLNGRNDFLYPLANQVQLFRLFGAPEKDKRHILFDGGHDLQLGFRDQIIKEVLDWLDRYLGPVALR